MKVSVRVFTGTEIPSAHRVHCSCIGLGMFPRAWPMKQAELEDCGGEKGKEGEGEGTRRQ